MNFRGSHISTRLPRWCRSQKLGLNLISEVTDKGRVYRIKDGKGSSADAVKAA